MIKNITFILFFLASTSLWAESCQQYIKNQQEMPNLEQCLQNNLKQKQKELVKKFQKLQEGESATQDNTRIKPITPRSTPDVKTPQYNY
jgi:cell shape-determining protein MreC